ncbi:FtsX-like permease family protein [Actinoalloteichus hymeniacidonis]|uniref:FtsX-like permease family n=1 Tax=Actinoalloteichus hymeniacidonis TaxID=340345 RepID=A0AAC9N179_9PSEU|nr:FtsX-like permease family protein [Actinoalloteichus hymeniacidonis]AOS65867.1 FtsX-like permease family [Actinoalloteichus hymeniacidonis]MBB5906039.1 hypothetical protein [Actinoalloteichus hymeniacidonis]
MSKAEGGVLRRWTQDLALGVRLAVGGSRIPWGRISLTSIGAGLGVAVLLLLASAGTAIEQRAERYYERTPAVAADLLEVDPETELEPFLAKRASFGHDGVDLSVVFLDTAGADPSPPPGLERMPEPGEIFISPALEELFDSPRGEVLQQRLGGRVADEIQQDGLVDPHERFAYVGTDRLRDIEPLPNATAYGFGVDAPPRDTLPPEVLAVLLVGIVAIVMPVVVFVANSTRMAESARDRRLAALRLVGADARQIRRIASGEALLGAGGGLAVGLLGFLGARSVAESFRVADISVFSSDLMPEPWAVIAIVIGLPVLAVTTAITAMRRVVVEPLGVVRLSQPIRRRLWWRLALVVLGFVGVIVTRDYIVTRSGAVAFSLSVAALLAGVPALLPWLLDKVIARLRGGPLPWQLAVRRLQLGSGTASRAVSGVAVLLAAMISLYAVINTVAVRDRQIDENLAAMDARLSQRIEPGLHEVLSSTTEESTPSSSELLAALESVPDVKSVFMGRSDWVEDADQYGYGVLVADCSQLEMVNALQSCEPGDAFVLADGGEAQLEPGQEMIYRSWLDEGESSIRWEVPADAQRVSWEPTRFAQYLQFHAVMLTPEAAAGLPVGMFGSEMYFTVDPGDQAAVDAALIALSEVDPLVDLWSTGRSTVTFTSALGSDADSTLDTVVLGLTLAGLLTFALIGSSLLVVAIEQIQERKRPLAVIAAVGAPRRTLSFSVLLQTLVPMVAALLVAGFIGTTIALAVLLPSSQYPVFEWTGIGLMALGALIVPVLVTLGTLPSLRRATRPEELRTE